MNHLAGLLRTMAGLALVLSFNTAAQDECECIWRGSFTDVQGDTDLVVAATVLSTKGNSIDLDISRILRGDEPPPPVRVWLKTADYCRPEVSEFPVDSRWIFALYRIEKSVPGGFNPGTPNLSYGRIGDFELSSCGGYWLREAGGRVTGNLVDAPRWVREPKMNPVLLDLVAAFVAGDIGPEALLAASKADPALKELMFDTRSFLRGGD